MEPENWMVLVVTVATIARITRLFTGDAITQPIRDWAKARFASGKEKPDIDYLLQCPWCFSVWTSILVVPVAIIWGDNRAVFGVMLGLTASWVAGNVQMREPKPPGK